MAIIFFSHASVDDALAAGIGDWLADSGFSEIFIDHRDIRGGDKWSEALRRSNATCKIVICLVTNAWLTSDECYHEFGITQLSGKRIIPLILTSGRLPRRSAERLKKVLSEDQGFKIADAVVDGAFHPDRFKFAEPLKAGLRAAGALVNVGLDPEAFEIDRTSKPIPFPGLDAFDDTDAHAALFYGRSDDIAACLEELRQMRAGGDRRSLAVLGASGSGKSSLLKAGVLPRLRRERGWIALRAFRPGADAVLNFAEAWSKSLAAVDVHKTTAEIAGLLRKAWSAHSDVRDQRLLALRQVLDELGASLRQANERQDATILIALDQAEELIRSDETHADIVCDCLRAIALDADAAAHPYPWACAFTIRSDSFGELQRNARFIDLAARCVDIRPLQSYRIDDVIERPAARYGVRVAPRLLSRIVADAQGEDTLPLLAFALRQLWKGLGQADEITENMYDELGGIAGLIGLAAERALRGARPHDNEPRLLTDEREALAESTFVPGLITVNDNDVPAKRVTALRALALSEIALLDDFVAWGLVVRKHAPEPIGTTVELAHEAILRFWPRLKNWLEPEIARLKILRRLDQAANWWHDHNHARDLLVHRGKTLRDTQAVSGDPRFAGQIGETQKAYLDAAAAKQQRDRKQLGLGIAAAVLLLLAINAILESRSRSRALDDAAAYYLADGDPLRAAPLALAAVPGRSQLSQLYAPHSVTDRLLNTGFELKITAVIPGLDDLTNARFSENSRWMISKTADGAGEITDIHTGLPAYKTNEGKVSGFSVSKDSHFVAFRSADNQLSVFDLFKGKIVSKSIPVTGLENQERGYYFVPQTSKLIVAIPNGDVSLWDLSTNEVVSLGLPTANWASWTLGTDTSHFILRSLDRRCTIWDAASVKRLAELPNCGTAFISDDGSSAAGNAGPSVHIWNGQRNDSLPEIRLKSSPLYWALSKGGNLLALTFADGHGEIWSARTGERQSNFCAHLATNTFAFSPDESRLIIENSDGSAVLCDTHSGKQIGKDFPPATVDSYFFAPKRPWLTMVSDDNHAILVDIQSGLTLTDFDKDSVVRPYYSPEGDQVFTTGDGKQGALWDMRSRRKIQDFSRKGISDVLFSKDGARAAINTATDRAIIWDMHANKLVTNVDASVGEILFSNDGSKLLVNPRGPDTPSILMEIPERFTRQPDGAGLRDKICRINGGVLPSFSTGEMKVLKDIVPLAAKAMAGEPRNPCHWRGLGSLEGWAQLLRRPLAQHLSIAKYRCGEISALGTMDVNEQTRCEEADRLSEAED